MYYSKSFSVLNESLRPRITTNEPLYSSLNRLEDRQSGSLRNKSSFYRPTVLPTEPQPKISVITTEPEDPEEPEDNAEQEDVVSDGQDKGNCADLLPFNNSCLISEFNLKDVDEEELVEEKDIPGELTSEGTGDSVAGGSGSSFQRNYTDGTLPDLIRSGRLLCRRQTLGHVSETLKEVRREVELSRRRSIKLKAQVDKLQESREGLGWSQHRERVTEEVLSVLRLLHPLTEPESIPPEPSHGENCLDAALVQLQDVARKLAITQTYQVKSGKGAEDSAILQQALRDRDEAIEKKKAMEAELLRSKTEMMLLNNQLLEAVQKRLELSLELEAWKEDVQLILQQQLQSQQQAEQAQKKPSRLGILRRNNRPPIQRPSNIHLSTPTTNSNQIFIPKSAGSAAPIPSTPSSTGTQRNWMDKLRRGKKDQDASGQDSELGRGDNGFQIVSLD
ncbi:bicaudal-D-related protein 2-like [Siniperca chuatsi]|uniref:bicaudal-D-related protein 2-like n=1 Tax=Siniperca chuatsi TaxID=119488 RepID=UPI001CE0BF5F|nr:bicaudal-D-related protein 2-like [Siniperca chuatsi]